MSLALNNAPNTALTPSFANIPNAPTPVAATPALIPRNEAILATPLATNFFIAPVGFANFKKISSKYLVTVLQKFGAAFLNIFPALSVINPRPFLTYFHIFVNVVVSSTLFMILVATFFAVFFPATLFNAAALTFINAELAPFFAPIFKAVVNDFSDNLFNPFFNVV